MMYREVIEKKKVTVITALLFAITIVLYLSQGIRLAGLNKYFWGDLLNWSLLVLMLFFTFKEVRSCTLSYKYAIIADKLIINKIQSRAEHNLESIKLSEILYVGRKSEVPKEYVKIKCGKSYLCNRIGDKVYCCIYKRGNRINKFNFQPSDLLIQRIIRHGK